MGKCFLVLTRFLFQSIMKSQQKSPGGHSPEYPSE